MPRRFDTSKFGLDHLKATAEKCKNWGRWGADDEIGTLNFITPKMIADAARLIRRGKVFSLGLNFDRHGPQRGLWGNRYNPIHTMLATGTDAVVYADDLTWQGLAGAIGRLLDDEPGRRRLGQKARERFERVLAWEYSAPQLLLAYERLWENVAHGRRRTAARR